MSVLSPGKYLAQARGGLLGRGRGWRGDPASDIPASLFPKHVQVSCRPPPIKPFPEILILRCQGLHASGNLAFVKDFEAFQQQDNEAGRGGARAAIAVDTWEVAGGYLALCPGPASSGLCDRAVWSQVCCCLKAESPASH